MKDMPSNDPAGPIASPFKGRTGLMRIGRAGLTACSGLAETFRHESAFRLELLLAAILVPAAFLLDVTAVERALLVASVLLVLVVELLNTSLEVAIDRISLEHHDLSRRAKDAGSAAVFVALVLLGAVWAIVVLPKFA